MKRSRILSGLTLTAAIVGAVSMSLWADQGKARGQEMIGTITVQWNDDGEATAIRFTSFENDRETPFEVKLDNPARALADLDGRRVALEGSFKTGAPKNTVSVKSFHITMTGTISKPDDDDNEDAEEEEGPRPIAYLDVSEGGDDEEGPFFIVDDTTSRRMLQQYPDQQVEVTATMDEEGHLRIRSYHCVLTGQFRMEAPILDEDDDVDALDDPKPQPVFVCNETGETYPLRADAISRDLQKNCEGTSLEVVATLGADPSTPSLTIHRYTTLHSGQIEVEESEDGAIATVKLVTPGGNKDQPIRIALEGRGQQLRDYHRERVTLTGSIREKDGVRWLTVRTIRA